MSKDELKKWEGKLRLWTKLHPEVVAGNMETLVYTTRCGEYCPHFCKYTCNNGKWKLGILWNEFTLKHVPFKKIVEDGKIMGCVEWVKHV